jgi:predicted metal-dependent peptidase
MLSTKARLPGVLQGRLQSEIQAATQARVDWRPLLARFMTGLHRSDYRMFPFNKKHLARGFYLPSIGVPGPDHLLVVVDTSGSMTDDELSEILGQIDRLRSQSECRLTLIQADANIQKVEEFSTFEEAPWSQAKGGEQYTLLGRGGTDFRPAFDWAQKSRERFDALIYLTDGFGSFPERAPFFPVLWILTRHSVPSVPFGSVVRLS